MVKLFWKNSNLCDHNSPTSHTDGQTTCDCKPALCSKVHHALTKARKCVIGFVFISPRTSLFGLPFIESRIVVGLFLLKSYQNVMVRQTDATLTIPCLAEITLVARGKKQKSPTLGRLMLQTKPVFTTFTTTNNNINIHDVACCYSVVCRGGPRLR